MTEGPRRGCRRAGVWGGGLLSLLALAMPTAEAEPVPDAPLDQCWIRESNLATMEIDCAANSHVSAAFLADRFAPVLWFSPDEPLLERSHAIPELLPGDREAASPVVYYQITSSLDRRPRGAAGTDKKGEGDRPFALEELSRRRGWLRIRYFFYYSEDIGANRHHHDLESADLKLNVFERDARFVLRLEQVTGYAHGLGWSANTLKLTKTDVKLCTEKQPPKGKGCGVDAGQPCECDTVFPVTLLIEEGKHATCPDRDGDGVYNPGYDVNVLTNEAWGVRDDFGQKLIHRTYEARMTKRRQVQDRRFPPLAHFSADDRDTLKKRYEKFSRNAWDGPSDRGGSTLTYQLRSTAQAARALLETGGTKDEDLVGRLVCIGDGDLGEHFEENDFYSFPRTPTRVWRWSREHTSFEFTRRYHEGLMTVSVAGWGLLEKAGFGGWIVPRVTLATAPVLGYQKARVLRRFEVLYTRTASRWLEYYANLNFNVERRLSDPELDRPVVPEFGLKLRFQLAEIIRGAPRFFVGGRVGVQAERKQKDTGPYNLRFVWQVGGGPW